MFMGSQDLRLDEKGRLILPAKFRAKLADGVVLTRGQEHCLYVFPVDVFQDALGEALTAPVTHKPSREYRRQMLAHAQDEVPDRQGRITVTAKLRAWAGLDRDVTIIGTGQYLELWDTAAWEAYDASSEAEYADLAEEVTAGKP